MSVVAITSSRTSPGATSLAAGLAIAWQHLANNALLIEADPAGGVLALRFDLAPAPSLTTFASDVRNAYSNDLVWANTQDLRGVHCMPAPVDPRLARSWIERVAPTLVRQIPHLGVPAVIDLGWVDEGGASAPIARAADTTLVVTSPDTAEVQSLLFQIRRLQNEGANVELVTVGDTPNNPKEIASLAGVPLAAVLPHDPRVADALAGGSFSPARFRRSLLWRTISGLAERLYDAELTAYRATHAPTSGGDLVGSNVASHEHVINLATSDGATPTAKPIPPKPTYNPAAQPVVASAPAPQLQAPDMPAEPAAAAPAALPVPAFDLRSSDQTPPTPVPIFDLESLNRSTPAPPVIVATYEPGAIAPVVGEASVVDPDLFDVTTRLPERMSSSLRLPSGEQLELRHDEAVIIGRHRDCVVALDDTQVSRRHGRLTRTIDGWHYADLGSRNGSRVNGQSCTETLLNSGDVLTVGRSHLTFETTSIREMECA